MNAIRRKLALTASLALALLLGACGEGDGPDCARNPTGPGCPVEVASPSPLPTPTPTPTPTPAPDVSGNWRSLARAWNFNLKQDGSNLSGVVAGYKNVSYNPSDPAVQINGTIDSSGNVAFSAELFGIEFSGVAETGGLRMTGTLRDCANGCRNYGEILEKQ
jgi:hypothetical protein